MADAPLFSKSLVQRLLEWDDSPEGPAWIAKKAAMELERLQADNERLTRELEIERICHESASNANHDRRIEVERLRGLLKQCEEELSWCESHWGADYSELRAKIRL